MGRSGSFAAVDAAFCNDSMACRKAGSISSARTPLIATAEVAARSNPRRVIVTSRSELYGLRKSPVRYSAGAARHESAYPIRKPRDLSQIPLVRQPVQERGGERISCPDRVRYIDWKASSFHVFPPREDGAPSRRQRNTNRFPTVTLRSRSAKRLWCRRQIAQVTDGVHLLL